MVHASQRILGKPYANKEPITSEMLKALVLTSKISDKSPPLSDLKTLALCLLGYAGFFRFLELCSTRACDIKFFPTYVSIFCNRPRQTNFVTGGVGRLQSRDQIKILAPLRRWSNTLLSQKLILVRICRCLELYRLPDTHPKSGVKAWATAEPGRSLRTLLSGT